MDVSSIVNVSITNTTAQVTEQGFATPLILGFHTKFAERYREYSSLAAMVSDGFSSDDFEYKAAAACFAQNPRPTSVIVGRRLNAPTPVKTVTPVAVHSYEYSVEINGTEFTYTADTATTASEIVTGLTSAINGGTEPVTASGTTTLVLTADVAGAEFTLALGGNLTVQDSTTANNVDDDLDDLLEASSAWYPIILTSHSSEEIAAAATWAEANQRLLLASTCDEDVRGASTTDLGSDLQDAAYMRTALMWHAAVHEFPEAAWCGKMLPKQPGSATWAYKTLAGVTVDELTDTQISNLRNKNVNFYVPIGGKNVTKEAKVSGGEWLDIVVGLDWTRARIQERVYARIVGLDKIPYTNAGVTIIATEIRRVLTEGANNGLYVLESITVGFPDVADISAQDKANRLLPDGEFSATLQGAIHATTINGTVSV
jgi:hypothetical protein